MGHTHGIMWTDEMVQDEILKIMKTLDIKRMPTRNEIIQITQNNALTNRISRTKGFYGWAKELNLPIKESETTFGKKYEYIVKDMLESKGYKADKMSQNYPYDLLVNNNIRVDVKVAKPYIEVNHKARFHTFNLYKRYATCDIYIIVCLNEKGNIEKVLIVPASKLKITQLSIGKKSIYDKYENNFKLLDIYDKFYTETF